MLRLSLALLAFLCAPTPASASPAEVREVVRINNCQPKKIEVYQQGVGTAAPTIYKVECIQAKAVGENVPKMPSSMLVRCSGHLCEMMRPLTETKK